MKPSFQQVDAKKYENEGFILADRQSFSERNFHWALLSKKETYR